MDSKKMCNCVCHKPGPKTVHVVACCSFSGQKRGSIHIDRITLRRKIIDDPDLDFTILNPTLEDDDSWGEP